MWLRLLKRNSNETARVYNDLRDSLSRGRNRGMVTSRATWLTAMVTRAQINWRWHEFGLRIAENPERGRQGVLGMMVFCWFLGMVSGALMASLWILYG
jgi:hypothetical protein